MRLRSLFASSLLFSLLASCSAPSVTPVLDTMELTSGSGMTLQEPGTYRLNLAEPDLRLESASNMDEVLRTLGISLSPTEMASLEARKFLLLPFDRLGSAGSGSAFTGMHAQAGDEMLKSFDHLGGASAMGDRTMGNARFINPDIMLHAYRILLQRMRQELEVHELRESLAAFVRGMAGNALQAAGTDTGPLKTRYFQIAAQFTVARVLLENAEVAPIDGFLSPDDQKAWTQKDMKADSLTNALTILKKYEEPFLPAVRTAMRRELSLIYPASLRASSSLFSQYQSTVKTDYTQYASRGHSAGSSALRSFARTMTYLTQQSYDVRSDAGLTDAVLVSLLSWVTLPDGATPFDLWKRITHIADFSIGKQSGVTLEEWNTFVSSAQKGSVPTSIDVSSVRTALKASELFATESEEQVIRIMGQRIALDDALLRALMTNGRITTPTTLLLSAVLGDDRAGDSVRTFLTNYGTMGKGAKNVPDQEVDTFLEAMLQKRQDMLLLSPDQWRVSLPSAWLWLLGSLTATYGEGYPFYMQSEHFAAKQIESFLGGYTEYKHDAQNVALEQSVQSEPPIETSISEVPPVPKAFIEPNMEFWWRLHASVIDTETLVSEEGLLKNSLLREQIEEFEKIVSLCSIAAQKEMMGIALTEDEYERLRTFSLSEFANTSAGNAHDTGAAMAAELYTDATLQQVLYEATAKPFLQLVLVGNERSPRIVAGLAFNHYEFTGPLRPRVTDGNWRAAVYDGVQPLPAKNQWYKVLLP